MQPLMIKDLKPGMAVKLRFSTGHEVTGVFEGFSEALSPLVALEAGRLLQVRSGDQTVYWKEAMISRCYRPDLRS